MYFHLKIPYRQTDKGCGFRVLFSSPRSSRPAGYEPPLYLVKRGTARSFCGTMTARQTISGIKINVSCLQFNLFLYLLNMCMRASNVFPPSGLVQCTTNSHQGSDNLSASLTRLAGILTDCPWFAPGVLVGTA